MKHLILVTMLLFGLGTNMNAQDNQNNSQTDDHCQNASDLLRDAADDFGNGNYGSAAAKLGQSAGAAVMCREQKKENQ